MLSKEEASELRSVFWNSWSAAMEKVRTANNRKVNWVNYPVNVKDCYCRMLANENGAYWYFDIQGKDAGIRQLLFEQMEEFKGMLENQMGQLHWDADTINPDSGVAIARISKSLESKSILRKNDWLDMHEFLKETIVSFDVIWTDIADVIQALSK